MAKRKNICLACRYAQWQYTKRGRVQRAPGKCTFHVICEVPASIVYAPPCRILPVDGNAICLDALKAAIWPQDEMEECAKFEAKESASPSSRGATSEEGRSR